MGLIEAGDYAESVRRATLFLEGRSDALTGELEHALRQAIANANIMCGLPVTTGLMLCAMMP